MTTPLVLRVTIPGIGSSFVPGDPDPLPSTDFWLTSKQDRSHHPYIEADENGVINMTQDGQRFDPMRATMQDGEVVLRAIDAKGLVPTCGGTILIPEGDVNLNLGPNAFVPGPLMWGRVETDSLGTSIDGVPPLAGLGTIQMQILGGELGLAGHILFGSDTYNGYSWRKFTGLTPGRRYAFRCRVNWGLDTGPGNLAIETVGGPDPYASTPGASTNRTSFPNGLYDFWNVDGTLNTAIFDGVISAVADSNGEIEFRFVGENYGGSCNVAASLNDMEVVTCDEIEDVNAPYYITAWTADVNSRQQLMNRKAYFELSYDGGTTYPDLLCVKYLTDYKMEVALVWDLTFGDTRRVERVAKAWRGFSPFDEPVLKHFTVIHGGVIGGFHPKLGDAGFRTYSVDATFTDPTGIEFPAVRIKQINGPPEDTFQHNAERVTGYFKKRVWPYSDPRIQGEFPGLSWYLLNPANDALLYGPLKSLGFQAGVTGDARKTTRTTTHMLQWFDHVTPITGPYKAVQVSDEPTEDFPLFIKANPIELLTTLFNRRGVEYDAPSAAAVRTALGYDTEYEVPVTDADETLQDLIDRLQLMFRFLVRRSVLTGINEFVMWGRKLDATPSIILDNTMIRNLGGPSFSVPNDSQINRISVSTTAISVWDPGTVMVPIFRPPKRFLGFAYTNPRVDYVARTADLTAGKPASGLVISKISETVDYATIDPDTPDADIYGEKPMDFSIEGLPAWRNGGPINFRQWVEAIAHMAFDRHGRGAPHVGFKYIRGTDADQVHIGDAVILDHDHVPNAQRGRDPSAERGGQRPYRCISMMPEFAGRGLLFVDEDSGDRYANVPDFTVEHHPREVDQRLVKVTPTAAFIADKTFVEFEARIFLGGEPVDVSDPGTLIWIDEAWRWNADPMPLSIGPFPAGADVYLRARAWQDGGAPSDWSLWIGIGGPVTPPALTLSNLIVSNITNISAQLDWSYDQSPQVDQVRVRYRDITSGIIPPYTTFSTLAAGTETETLTGLTDGHRYQVEVVLWDGAADVGTPLTAIFSVTGGKISALIITSPAADGAKLNWTNTDGSRMVRVEYRVQGTTSWILFNDFSAGTNRTRLVGLVAVTTYDVQVSLLAADGTNVGDGANGPSLTDDFTTLAVTVQLDFPLMGGAFEAFDPYTMQRHDGRFGFKVHANPNITVAHKIVPLLATETAIGSGVAGAYAEQTPIDAVPGADMYFMADAANDQKRRYMKAISRAPGYTDSIETVEVSADPWPDVGPTPPVGGGISQTFDVEATGLAENAHGTGSPFALPDGAEIFRVDSPESKNLRLRLYRTDADRIADESRSTTDTPTVPVLLDVSVTTNEAFSYSLVHRIRLYLQDLPDRVIYWTITNYDAATQDVPARIFYFASSVGTLP